MKVPLGHNQDPTVVRDPLGKCVQVAPDEQDVAFAKVSSRPSHIDLLVLKGDMSVMDFL